MVAMTAFRKRHSTTGWMAVNCSLMKLSTRECSSSMLRFTATEKSGSTSRSRGSISALMSPGFGEVRLRVPISCCW